MESLGPQTMTISGGTTAHVQQNASEGKLFEGQVIQLEDGSTAFVQQVTLQKAKGKFLEPFTCEDGQPTALADGTVTFIYHTPKEGYDPNILEAIQLEEGSTTSIHHPVSMSGGPILAMQADVGLEELVVGEKNSTFDLNTITAFNDCASKSFQGEEVRSNGKESKPHNRVYICEYSGCSCFFTTFHRLKISWYVHTGDYPYSCNFSSCGETIATGYNLKSHLRTHTGEKPYKCPEDLCTKAFKTSGGCGCSFTTSNIHKVHIQTHLGERPYMCPEPKCEKGLTSTTNYKNHIRIHTGETPYVCPVPGCGKCFTEYSSLYKHHVVHTHRKPYSCNTCGKTYRRTSTLAMHKCTTHGELESTEES